MAQQLIDFGSFPDDPTADAIRTAFQKVQQNFGELYSGAAGQAVYSVNRTPGAGITVNAPTGNVVVTANIACVQVETSTLSIGITANGGQNAVYTQSNQVLVIDLPDQIVGITDITISGNLTANRVTANNDMYTGTLSATGNANVANLNSANNVTGTNLTITNGMMSGNFTLGNLTMSGTVKSHLIPSPPNTQNLGNTTNNWGTLYTQDIVMAGTPISGIGKVVPSFGNVYLNSNVAVAGTTTGTATTILSFTFPNAGYYRVNTLLITQPASTGVPPVSFALFDNTGTLVPNSEIMLTTATGGTSQTITGTGVIDIQVAGAYTYTVRAWGVNTPNILTYAGNGRSSVNWLKLDPTATISTTGNVTYGNLTVTGETSLNTVSTTGNANIGNNLNVSGNAIIAGNLTVDGNIVYINVTDLSVEDPIINLQTGPNGAPLVANTGKDVGLALNYFSTSPKVAWMGWDNSTQEITFGEDVTIASEVVSYSKYANIRAGNIIGPLANGSSNIYILQNANINFAVNGNGNRVEVGEANTYVNNQLWANSNIYIKNTGTGPALFFQDDVGGTTDTYWQYLNSSDSVVLFVNGTKVIDSNASNTFINGPLTTNANLVINNVGDGGKITFIDDVSTNTDTSIGYVNASDSIVIKVNSVDSIQSNAQGVTVTGNVVISGNLAVDGNITYINTETLAIEDPIIQLQTGPNGAAPVSNSGKDIGTALNYYDSAARVAFMGWDTSNVEFGFASRATITNEIVAFNTYGNVRAGNIIAKLANGTSNISIQENGPILINPEGAANTVNVSAAITYVNNQLIANNNMYINNTGAGSYLYFLDDVIPSNDTYIVYENSTDRLRFFLNSSEKFNLNSTGANVENGNLTVSGNTIIQGGGLLTTLGTFSILPANATTVSLATAATTLEIGAASGTTNINNNLDVDGDINMDGGDFTVSTANANLMNTNANLINAFGAANTLNIGSTSGTLLLRNPTLIGSQPTQNLYNTVATTVNVFGVANVINMGKDEGTMTLRNPTLVGANVTQNVYNTVATTVNAFGVASTLNIGVDSGTVLLRNPTLVGANVTQNVYNTVATTVNAFGAGNIVNIGKDEGTMTLRNPTIVGANVTQNLFNTVATTVNFAGAGTNVNIASATGNTTVKNNLVVNGNLTVDQDIIFSGCDIDANCVSLNMFNGIPQTINFGGNTSTFNIGNTLGTVTLRNPTLVGSNATQNVYNTIASTVNAFGDANVINMGKNEGTMTLRNPTLVGANATQNVYNTVASTINVFGEGNVINLGKDEGTLLLRNPTVIGANVTQNLYNTVATTVNAFGTAATLNIGNTAGTVTLRNPTLVGTENTQNVYNTVANTVNAFGFANVVNIGKDEGTMTLRNPTLVGANVTQNVYNTTATTVNAFGTAATLNIGVDSGTVLLRNPTLVGANITQNVYNTIASTVNAFGNANVINMGKDEGTMTLRNPTIVGANVTQNLFNTVATTVNAFGSASSINMGAAGSLTRLRGNLFIANALNFADANGANTDTAIYYTSDYLGITLNGSPDKIIIENTQVTINDDLVVKGGDIITNQSSFNLLNTTATTINFGGAASTLNMGATSGTATLANPTLVGTQATQNVYNTTATTVNAFGAAGTLNIGVDSGTALLRNPTLVGANVTQNVYNTTATTVNAFGAASTLNIGVDSGTALLRNPTLVGANVTQNVYNTTATTVNAFGDANVINMGKNEGTMTLRNPTLVGANSTQNIYNTVATTVNAFGAATNVNIGNNSGTMTLRNPTIVGTETTQNIFNSVANTINFGGAANTIEIGAATGNTNINHNLVVDGNLSVGGNSIVTGNLTIQGNLVYVNVETLEVEDPIIQLQRGPNGAAPVANTGKDVGTALNYYNTQARVAFMGWDVSNVEFGLAASATITNEVVTFDSYGDLRINNLKLNAAINFSDANASNTDTSIYYNNNTDNYGISLNGQDKIEIFNSNTTIHSNLIVDFDLAVNGGDITSNQAAFNLLNVTPSTINFGANASTINIGNTTGTATLRNPTLVGSQTTQNVYDTVATTVNAFGAAATLNMGATSGTATLRNPTLVGSQTTQNVYDTVATTVNAFGAAATLNIGATSGTATLRNPTLVGSQTTQNVYDTVATTVNAFGAASTLNMGTTSGTATLRNPTIVGSQATQNVYNTVATTVNAFGAATSLNLGATSGTATINNPTIVGTQTTQNLFNSTATTVNFAGAGTDVNIGAATGNTTIKNNLVVSGNISLDADIILKGCDLNTDCTTFNLINANATTVYFAGAATSMNIGANGVSANIRGNLSIDKAINFNTISSTNDSIYYNSATFNIATGGVERLSANATVILANANLQVTGTEITTNAAAVNLANTTTTTINFGGAATTLNIGAATGNTTIKNNLIANANIETVLTTLNLANANSTTVNFAGAATQINMGASTGNTKVNNNIIANANIETVLTTLNLANANSTTVNFAGAGTAINIGAATGNTTVNHNLIANGNIETKLTTLNLANANSTTINFAGAGTNVNIGASTGNTTVNNNLIVKGNIELDADLILKGCDFNTNCTSFNLVNANATTVYFAGAGTTVEIGAATGNTNVNNNLDVDGNLNIDGTSLTVTQATFNLANANATTINFGGAATNVVIGATGATTKIPGNVYIDASLGFGAPTWTSGIFYLPTPSITITLAGTGKLEVTNTQVVANANLAVTGSNLLSTSSTFSICDAATTSTLNLGRGASQLNLGAASSNSAFGGNIYVTGNINVNGGGISGPATLSIGSTSSTIQMGSSGGVVTMNGNANVTNLNASANVVATTAVKTGSITLNGGNGFIYTNGDVQGANVTANGQSVMYGNGLITAASFSTPTGITLFANGTAQATLFAGSGASLSSLTGANVTGTVANATYATSAGTATSATSATNAGFATSAGSASTAGFATSAGSASYADAAGCAYSTCADVAEYYLADNDYPTGTVLEYGGPYEVTLSRTYDSHRFAGVISSNPAVIMNLGLQGDHRALVALIGRVPVKVQGHIEKGDLMVCAPNGYAVANNMARAGTIIGKALENFDGESGIIEIVVGRN